MSPAPGAARLRVRAVTVHPGGVKTAITRNARYHSHRPGPDVSHEEAAREFEAMPLTTPERAAKIIHGGVTAGKSRILVGPDRLCVRCPGAADAVELL